MFFPSATHSFGSKTRRHGLHAQYGRAFKCLFILPVHISTSPSNGSNLEAIFVFFLSVSIARSQMSQIESYELNWFCYCVSLCVKNTSEYQKCEEKKLLPTSATDTITETSIYITCDSNEAARVEETITTKVQWKFVRDSIGIAFSISRTVSKRHTCPHTVRLQSHQVKSV